MNDYNTLDIGQVLNSQYEIVGILGTGGFGITYKVKDKYLDRFYVIKEFFPSSIVTRHRDATTVVLQSQKEEDIFKWGIESFLQEAKALAKFKHPNIVQINGFFEENNTAYFVMPFEDGMVLSDYMKENNKRWSEEEIKNLIVPILNGLMETHNKGVIHRDIKPGNIFIRKHGMPMLIDFGAARDAFGEKSKSITQMLTPPYAPVEQYGSDRKRQGPWTDIYAVGMVIYKLIYQIDSQYIPPAPDRQSALFNGEEDPLKFERLPGYSEHFLEVVKKALSVKPSERYQTAQQMIDDMFDNENEVDKKNENGETSLSKLEEYIFQIVKDGKITKEIENSVLSKANELNIPKEKAEEVFDKIITTHNWKRFDNSVGEVKKDETTPKKSNSFGKFLFVILVLVGVGFSGYFITRPHIEFDIKKPYKNDITAIYINGKKIDLNKENFPASFGKVDIKVESDLYKTITIEKDLSLNETLILNTGDFKFKVDPNKIDDMNKVFKLVFIALKNNNFDLLEPIVNKPYEVRKAFTKQLDRSKKYINWQNISTFTNLYGLLDKKQIEPNSYKDVDGLILDDGLNLGYLTVSITNIDGKYRIDDFDYDNIGSKTDKSNLKIVAAIKKIKKTNDHTLLNLKKYIYDYKFYFPIAYKIDVNNPSEVYKKYEEVKGDSFVPDEVIRAVRKKFSDFIDRNYQSQLTDKYIKNFIIKDSFIKYEVEPNIGFIKVFKIYKSDFEQSAKDLIKKTDLLKKLQGV